MKPIILHAAPPGPNPWKPAIVLEELGLPYEIVNTQFAELKQKPYTDLNPNGRSPVIQDPNNGLVLWESGAIVQYLISEYDTEHQLTYTTFPEKYHVNQWLMYQMSGQGPYFGQCSWFNLYHPEALTSARSRYIDEVNRVVAVLDGHLKGKIWLVGNKCTFADLAFVMWNMAIPIMMQSTEHPERFDIEQYPNFKAWQDRMMDRESVKKCCKTRQDMMDAEGRRVDGKKADGSN